MDMMALDARAPELKLRLQIRKKPADLELCAVLRVYGVAEAGIILCFASRLPVAWSTSARAF
jgi:hypothetical protein